MNNPLVLFQLVTNIQVNADFARTDISQFQSEKPRVRNRRKGFAGAFEFSRIKFLFAHPR